jgi:hypothetical protein
MVGEARDIAKLNFVKLSGDDDYLSGIVAGHLRIVFAANAIDGDFHRHFPALFDFFRIVHIGRWGDRLLKQFAEVLMGDEVHVSDSLTDALVSVHGAGAFPVDTARHFTRFVAEFLRTFKAKGDQIDSEREYLTRVLRKLSQMRNDVVRMDAELRAKQAELSEKDAQAEARLETVLREKRDAQQSRESMPHGVKAYSGLNFGVNHRIATVILGQVLCFQARSVGKLSVFSLNLERYIIVNFIKMRGKYLFEQKSSFCNLRKE